VTILRSRALATSRPGGILYQSLRVPHPGQDLRVSHSCFRSPEIGRRGGDALCSGRHGVWFRVELGPASHLRLDFRPGLPEGAERLLHLQTYLPRSAGRLVLFFSCTAAGWGQQGTAQIPPRPFLAAGKGSLSSEDRVAPPGQWVGPEFAPPVTVHWARRGMKSRMSNSGGERCSAF
jgi:hypothetical protein